MTSSDLSIVRGRRFWRNSDLQRKILRATEGKPLTQATAIKALNDFVYCPFNRGRQYLDIGWREQSQDIGKRRCHFPDLPYQINYLRKHLLGEPFGIVKDDATTGVPYIPVDLDRHDPNIDPGVHMEKCLGIGRYLQTINPLHWAVEINPLDGSTKFFGFLKSGNIIPWIQAGMFGESIHQQLVSQGLCHGNNIEVFPFNSKAVFLPMRPDKFTICGKGFLPRANATVQEKRVINLMGDTATGKYSLRTYSALAFLRWLQSDDNYSESHLQRALQRACHHVPKAQEEADEFTLFLKHHQRMSLTGKPIPFTEEELDRLSDRFQAIRDREISAPASQVADKGSLAATQIDDLSLRSLGSAKPIKAKQEGYRNDSDAFLRNHDDCKPFFRDFFRRNKRQPTDGEFEQHIKANNLYSGDWSDREHERKKRLSHVAQWTRNTFDETRIGNGHVAFDLNYKRLARKLFPEGITWTQTRVSPFGKKETETMHVPLEFLETLFPIVCWCLKNPNKDNSVPTERIKRLWELFPEAANWNQKRYSAAWRHLDKAGYVNIYDKKYGHRKAMRWCMGRLFPGQKRKHQPRPVETRSLDLAARCQLGSMEWEAREIHTNQTNQYKSLYHIGEFAIRSHHQTALKLPSRPPPDT